MNKDLDYYLSLPYRIELIEDVYEGGYVASLPELPGCVTCSETPEGAISNVMDAKKSGLRLPLKMELIFVNP